MVPGGSGGTGGLYPQGFSWTVPCMFRSSSFLRQRSCLATVLLGLCRAPFWFPTPSPLLVLTVARLGAPCTDSSNL